ncbi:MULTISPECIES: ATP-dependent endonuclease [Lysinibacillus]|uniref:ATP-dependent nuclease n=1 Tax=Lysinibacillus TaxID=400634 RepID=UPI00214CC685|nr:MULTISPECIES: AAA family ATPase [Lysinibacillus]UUV23649.1 AAA family ATPase [Lysinibacillus sp. FN11]UYB46520.1 AAA family ATPase [Lysinibacillus capsici]
MHITKLKIWGLKKFEAFEIEFNEHINVLIGENEAGKSTILEAIDIVLNQRLFNNNATVEKYFNLNNINKFQDNPSIDSLPEIKIEVIFNDDDTKIDNEFYCGLHSSFSPQLKCGITFTYKFDQNYRELFEIDKDELSKEKSTVPIPTEYYIAEWMTFAGRKYISRNTPIKNVLIDNSTRRNNIFDSYSKKIFNANIDGPKRQKLGHEFKKRIHSFITDNNGDLIIKDYTIGIDENKTILDNLVDLKSDGISIQNKGKGKENLIKTEIALEVNSDLIMLEEPENHLSYVNTRKLINDIQQLCGQAQIIITTHNPSIVSRLNIRNTLWICDYNSFSLKAVNQATADYFMKTDNMQLLNFILSNKVILVEGNSEYILLPTLTYNSFKNHLDNLKIEVLSGGGITYKHYIEISKIINNNLLVITDNDENQDILDEITAFNDANSNILIKCGNTVDEFTFEVCLYNENKSILKNISNKKSKTQASYKNKPYDKDLAYMLKNKTESALRITTEEQYRNTLLPNYIKEGIEWLIQQ